MILQKDILDELNKYELLIAYQRLSPRAQFEQWLSAQGRTWPDPDEVLGCPSLAALVAVGMEWMPCTVRLPDEDRYGRLHFLAWSPRDPDWLTACRYLDGWSRVSDRSLMSGVTHWRIVRGHERFSRAATPSERQALESLNPKKHLYDRSTRACPPPWLSVDSTT